MHLQPGSREPAAAPRFRKRPNAPGSGASAPCSRIPGRCARCAAYPVGESRSGRGAPHRGGTPHTGGIDVHKAYGTIALVGHVGTLLREEPRVRIGDGKPSLEALEGFWPVEVVVATCSFWPWIHGILEARRWASTWLTPRRWRRSTSSPPRIAEMEGRIEPVRKGRASLFRSLLPRPPQTTFAETTFTETTSTRWSCCSLTTWRLVADTDPECAPAESDPAIWTRKGGNAARTAEPTPGLNSGHMACNPDECRGTRAPLQGERGACRFERGRFFCS